MLAAVLVVELQVQGDELVELVQGGCGGGGAGAGLVELVVSGVVGDGGGGAGVGWTPWCIMWNWWILCTPTGNTITFSIDLVPTLRSSSK